MASFFDSVYQWFSPQYNKSQTQVLLKSGLIRLRLYKAKVAERAKAQRFEVVQLSKLGKDEMARIKAEHIIRDTNVANACDILEVYIEKVQSRLDLLDLSASCPEDTLPALHTLIFAGYNLSEVSELLAVNQQFGLKYGQDFIQKVVTDSPWVNPEVKNRLIAYTPPSYVVQNLLNEILGRKEVSEPSPSHVPFVSPTYIPTNQPSAPTYNYSAPMPMSPSPNIPYQQNIPSPNFTHGPATQPDGDIGPDLDDLTARFEALKKRSGRQ